MSTKAVVKVTSFFDQFTAPKRFKKLKDGWVKDNLLGLDWASSSNKIMNWDDAQKYCANLKGRLPTRRELESLIDLSKKNPAINTEAFPDTKTDDWYWTGTEIAGESSYAWFVYFIYGGVGNYPKVHSSYVRAVRPSR